MFFICEKSIQQIWESIIRCCYKSRTRSSKNCFQKVVHKAIEETGGFIGNKIADKIVKPKLLTDKNSINVEEIVIPPKKGDIK